MSYLWAMGKILKAAATLRSEGLGPITRSTVVARVELLDKWQQLSGTEVKLHPQTI